MNVLFLNPNSIGGGGRSHHATQNLDKDYQCSHNHNTALIKQKVPCCYCLIHDKYLMFQFKRRKKYVLANKEVKTVIWCKLPPLRTILPNTIRVNCKKKTSVFCSMNIVEDSSLTDAAASTWRRPSHWSCSSWSSTNFNHHEARKFLVEPSSRNF